MSLFRFLIALVAVGLLNWSTIVAAAADELVDAKWLAERLKVGDVVVLDVQEEASFRQHHLPGSVNIPYSRWRTGPGSKVPGNLPSIERLEMMLGSVGISETDHVVVVATGLQPGDLSAMARVFWTLRLLGHQRLSLVDGGLADYARNRLGPLMRGQAEKPETKTYKASPDRVILATADDVMNGQIVDARSRAEYLGLLTGSEDERPGTVPGSINLPFDWLAENAGGALRSEQAMKSLFEKAGVKNADGSVHFCHTGNRASLTWFVDYAVLGNRKARLYDASMSEWARDDKRPMDHLWKLN